MMSIASTSMQNTRRLTEADIRQYRQIFQEARSHTLSPTLSASPPSLNHETDSSFSSSIVLGKRKRDEGLSTDSPEFARKKAKLKDYHVAFHVRRGPNSLNRSQAADNATKYATWCKRRADVSPITQAGADGAYYYAKSILNYAFAFRLRGRDVTWRNLMIMMDLTIDRYNKLARTDKGMKMRIWLSYLQLLKHAIELQDLRDQINVWRAEIDQQVPQAEKKKQKVTKATASSSDTPAANEATNASTADSTKSPQEAEVADPPSAQMEIDLTGPETAEPSPAPILDYPEQVPMVFEPEEEVEERKLSLSYEHARELRSLLFILRNGLYPLETKKRIIAYLNPATLLDHYPRTTARAFGDNLIGHWAAPPAEGLSQSGAGPSKRLSPWEEYEIHDLEKNEQKGTDFPYPMHAEDIFWVVILGRSMLEELYTPKENETFTSPDRPESN